MQELLCEWKLYQLVSLLALLRVHAENYVNVAGCLGQIHTALSVPQGQPIRQDLAISALGKLDGIRSQFEAVGLTTTVAQIDRINERWNQYHDYGVLLTQCQELLHRLEDELKNRFLLILPSGVQSRYSKPLAEWEECIGRFPQTIENIEEMNRCFALSCYAASVFHSLLIVEAGLIELGKYIGVTDPKVGWDGTCRTLENLCKQRTTYSGPIPFASLEQINQIVQSMKLAWRNKVNHEAGRLSVLDPHFTPSIAEEIILSTRSLMRRLATDIPK